MSARPVAQFVDQAERNSASEIAERFDYSVPRTTYFSFLLFFFLFSLFSTIVQGEFYTQKSPKK